MASEALLLNVMDHLNCKMKLDAFKDEETSETDNGNNTPTEEESAFLETAKNVAKEQFLEALDSASRLNSNVVFETFNAFHMQCAEDLINALFKIDATHLEESVSFAKKYVNASLLNYVISVILRHRSEAIKANIQLPSHVCTNPEMYFDMTKINEKLTTQQVKQKVPKNKNEPIFVDVTADFTSSDLDQEHRVAYFREDIGVNLHHRHWHEVYPHVGSKEIVYKDRRGELFFYMHQQILARYNFERLCNSLNRTKPFNNFREPIQEAYFPKLDVNSKVRLWSPRQVNAVLKDLYRDGKHQKLAELERWRDRLYDVVDSGHALVKNEDGSVTWKRLVEPSAIDELGNTVEAAPSLSWNSQYYGDLHNTGHLFISYCHDPDYRFRELGCVMSHSESALRDPMFYRWHVFIDDIFQQYKSTLSPYTLEERQFTNIEIEDLEVVTDDTNTKNQFNTFWQKDTVNVSEGILNMDAENDSPVFATFSHINHEKFSYKLTVNNTDTVEKTGTVRIFYAPKYDESKVELTFNSQRKLFVELDKFTATLKVGSNLIERKSTSSSITIPFQQSFMTVEEAKKYTQMKGVNIDLSYCGCGWPQHLLVGKGNSVGYECVLFVMITDYEADQVEGGSLETECCLKSAVSFCGVRDKKYPDKRSMGFPFDRNVSDANATLYDFMTASQKPSRNRQSRVMPKETGLSNMRAIDIKIKFKEKTVDGPSILRAKKACAERKTA